jgi:hypothetical protein
VPVLNERATFTATTFTFYKDDQPTANGTYALAPVSLFCSQGSSPAPGLQFTATNGSSSVPEAMYTLSGNQLVLDYGSACDAARDTYERLPQ